MGFNSLDTIFQLLAQQPGWEKQERYRHLLACWKRVVDPQIAEHSRPSYIARQVLWVATSNSVWAQTLSLQRHSLLKKLNLHLSEPIVDIRFSPAQWHNKYSSSQSHPQAGHPSETDKNAASQSELDFLPQSLLEATEEVKKNNQNLSEPIQKNPEASFQRWIKTVQGRSQNFSLCPHCQCPTPPAELQRWHLCAYCAAKQWSLNSRTNSD